MKKNISAAVLAALLLCACGNSSENAETTQAEASSVIAESTETASCVTSETITVQKETSAEAAETVSTAAVTSETTAESSQTETSSESISEPEPPVSEIITETEYSELLSTESISETETVSETAVITTLSAVSKEKAPVVVPKIKTGNFSGEKMLENDLAAVDISSADAGVIKITYKGKGSKVKVRITKDEAIYDYSLDPEGTVFPLQSGSGTYNVKVLENVSGKTYAIVLDKDFKASVDELSPYLLPTQYINFADGDKCVYKAAELCAGKSGNIEKASAMFQYITENITYDKELAASVKSGYVPDPDSTLERGKGICFDYASLFASMCRSQGIPAKLVMGYVRGDVYHAWNEIYTSETGWITVDLFLDSKGWNLLDPTFYASASDKAGVSEYIGAGSDYSAVYYY